MNDGNEGKMKIAPGGEVPLCVDLDGTLIQTDCSWEASVQMLFHHPLRLAGILPAFWRGRAWAKRRISLAAPFPVESLPYNADVISLITREKSAGRKILLVTAADQHVADAIAAHLKFFDQAIGSDGVIHLKGPAKAALLVKMFGRGGFDYMGDSAADIPVWEAARHAYAVNPAPAAGKWIAQHRDAATVLGSVRRSWGVLARSLRPRH